MMVLVLIIAARSKIYKYYYNLLEFFLFLEMVALCVVIHFSHFFFRESGARETEYLNTSLILTGLPSKEFAIRSIKITFYFSSFSPIFPISVAQLHVCSCFLSSVHICLPTHEHTQLGMGGLKSFFHRFFLL